MFRSMALPLTRLHIPFLSARVARAVESLQTERNVKCRLYGLQWTLDLSELIDFNIFYLRSYERFSIRRFLQFARPGAVVFDIGANVGYYALRAARHVGPEGRVYAFEPMERSFDRLRRHVHLNALGNVIPERIVVTDASSGACTVAFKNSWKIFGVSSPPNGVGRDGLAGRIRE
jgi:tRNA G37 N-methylase Trm5